MWRPAEGSRGPLQACMVFLQPLPSQMGRVEQILAGET